MVGAFRPQVDAQAIVEPHRRSARLNRNALCRRESREAYYQAVGGLLEKLTGWRARELDHAFDGTEAMLPHVFQKAAFWRQRAEASLNKRQRDILNRLLDGFEGKLTSSFKMMALKSNRRQLRSRLLGPANSFFIEPPNVVYGALPAARVRERYSASRRAVRIC